MTDQDWIYERNEEGFSLGFKVKERLFCGKSDFQKVEIVDTYSHGKVLLNDDLVMLSERDEFAYHDMITHLPLFTHGNPLNVLVIGGGDGGTAREVLRHKSVERCVMIEIDKMVVDACIEHIPVTSKDLTNHPKLELLIEDGVKYVKETKERFDVIIIDSTDPIGPATPLFGEEFYQNVNRILTDDGIVVSQGESPYYNADVQHSLLSVLNKVFENVYIYNFSNLTYPGGLWSFTFASKSHHPFHNLDKENIKKSGLKFKYYNERIHEAAFSLPSFMREKLEGLIKN